MLRYSFKSALSCCLAYCVQLGSNQYCIFISKNFLLTTALNEIIIIIISKLTIIFNSAFFNNI